MRRVFVALGLCSCLAWLFFSACEKDRYRDELPLRPLTGEPGVPFRDPVDIAPQDAVNGDMGSSDGGTDFSTDGGTDSGTDGGTVGDGAVSG